MYVLKNQLGEKQPHLTEEMLRNIGYYTVVNSLYEVLIVRAYEKLRTVWIQG